MKVTERKISIDEVFATSMNGQLKEAFGTGTAAVISPVGEICHNDDCLKINNGQTGPFSKKLYDYITAMQYGDEPDKYGWVHTIAG